MSKHSLPAGLAFVGGLVGFGLRYWMLTTGFTEDGLPLANAPSIWALVLVSLILVAVFWIVSRKGMKLPFPGGYDQAFNGTDQTMYLTLMVAAAFLLAGSGAYTVFNAVVHRTATVMEVALGLLNLASAACIFRLGHNNYRNKGQGQYSMALLIPAYSCCLWLVHTYQVYSVDPVILHYVYTFLAIMAVMVATYAMAGFGFEKAKVFQVTFFGQLAIYLTLVTLADMPDLATLLQQVAYVLYLVASVSLLRYNVLLEKSYTQNLKEEPSNG